MSLHIDAVMHQVFAGEEWFLSCPTKPFEVYTFLWMCAHPPQRGETARWEAMDWSETGPAAEDAAWLPLYLRPYALFRTALDWFEAEGLPEDFPGYAVLAAVLHQGGDLGVAEAGDVLDVVRFVGFEQQQRVRAMVGHVVVAVEVGVAGGDDALAAVPALGENGEVILGALGLAADHHAARSGAPEQTDEDHQALNHGRTAD
jgi:hypothetical protein